MAHVNKPSMIKGLTGMNGLRNRTPSTGAVMAQGGDNVPAMIHSQSGQPIGPAAIKEGEIIFSVEAVIGAGQGDFQKGTELLLALHDKLRELGIEYLRKQQGSQGLNSVQPPQG